MHRHQLAVASPVTVRALLTSAVVGDGDAARSALVGEVRRHFGSQHVVLTDSGTSALVLALRLTVGAGGTVAFPGYGCLSLAAAARRARVRVLLYDLDPFTLGADLGSLERALLRGARAVVVAHLFGFPADVHAARSVADRYGVPVIEDAAQASGGSLAGTPLGGLGALSILSFGRGKGITGGSGGALLANNRSWVDPVADAERRLAAPSRGWNDAAQLAAQWLLGRPSLYAVPASIPALHLGEMVYRRAAEPAVMSTAAAHIARAALASVNGATARRRALGARLARLAARAPRARVVDALPQAHPGYLRLPVLVESGAAAPLLGIVRPYPRALREQRELVPCLSRHPGDTPGAFLLRRDLVTLPTHHHVTEADVHRIAVWLGEHCGSDGNAFVTDVTPPLCDVRMIGA